MRLLDLYCGEGGAAAGYIAAGFDVTGVDIVDRSRRYPGHFVQCDALEYLAEHGHEYDAIHASPPCHAYSRSTINVDRSRYPDLVDATREALAATELPWVMENVPGAPLRDPMTLCGSMFGLRAHDPSIGRDVVLRRHRLFESNALLWPPGPCRHDPDEVVGGVYGGGSATLERARTIRRGGYTPPTPVRTALMGMPWATQQGVNLAIPPAYTRWIGSQLIEVAR